MNIQINHIYPLIALAAGAVLILLIAAIGRNHRLVNMLALSVLIVSAYSLSVTPDQIAADSLFTADGFSGFFILLILGGAFMVVLLSYHYLEHINLNREEFYVLILTGTLGACALASAQHMVSFFLGLELLSVSLYVLAGYLRMREKAVEASLKYLILSGVSSAFLLMGMALLYGRTGTMAFAGLAENLQGMDMGEPVFLIGVSLIFVGAGFKMAVVPFHLWTPDVYQGAPSPVAAFIASVSKGGIVALWLRFFLEINGGAYPSLLSVFSIVAILSMLGGNILALLQRNVKRILAYSSIAHLGYIWVAFISGGERGAEAVAFYLLAYFITILAAFGVVTVVSDQERDGDDLSDYQGLFWRRPALAAVFTASMLSLAGIPLTVGFIGKFYILSAGIGANQWILSLMLVIGSAISVYYYLKIIVEMFKKPDEIAMSQAVKPSISFNGKLALTALTVLLIWLGVYPSGVSDIIRVMVGF